ncbi:hypothetical protein PybrP1_007484 [[Pythium] brassicae (nom. inval.)]|nr:hypothetical protein PybrP1_007484 [[Pythium] brassicae (nom. inval.)]
MLGLLLWTLLTLALSAAAIAAVVASSSPPSSGTAVASASAASGGRRKKKRANRKPPASAAGPPGSAQGATRPSDALDALSTQNAARDGGSSGGRSSLSRRVADDVGGASDDDDVYSDVTADDAADDDYFSSESEEEETKSYKPGGYHRVEVGQVYKNRFEVLAKLGWGHFSTVWKCLDRRSGGVVALKVQKSARHYTEAALDEIELLKCTVDAATAGGVLESIKVVRLIDSFTHAGPNGNHVCMVFEMLGDNLLTLIKYYNYRGIPMALVKRLSRDILEALAFLHAKCRIIHTDLKPENVLLSHHVPRLPKLQRAAYLRFCSGEPSQSQSQSHTSSAAGGGDSEQLSRDEKKKLKKKQKKKQKKQQLKSGTPPSVDPHAVLVANFCVAESLDESQDGGTRMVPTAAGAPHGYRGSNSQLRRDAGVNEDDDEDDDWVGLAPEFAARVMLLLPEGRVAGSRKKDIEFTIAVTAEVRTSFSLRYLDRVRGHVVAALEEGLSGAFRAEAGSGGGASSDGTKTSLGLWKAELDARYLAAVLEHLEKHVEGLVFLSLPAVSAYSYPGFYLPRSRAEPTAVDAATKAAAAPPSAAPAAEDRILQGVALAPLAAGAHRTLAVPPLAQRLAGWRGTLDELAASARFDALQLHAKVCDLGNACWTHKHFTDDIQTRQYRSPEVILGKKYDTSADMWSMACFVFELLTGDLLFDPKSGRNFNRDEDHLAQMIELLGRMPKAFTSSGRGAKEFFTRKGELKRIRSLKYWTLDQVLVEKYRFSRRAARSLASFLEPMLQYDPARRVTADEALQHPWLLDSDASDELSDGDHAEDDDDEEDEEEDGA